MLDSSETTKASLHAFQMLTNREQTAKIRRLKHGQAVGSSFYNLLIFEAGSNSINEMRINYSILNS